MKKTLSILLALVMLITAIPLGSLVASAEVLRGDANNDGEVTALDARITLQVSVGEREVDKETLEAIDMNNDDKITTIDARKVLKAAAGIEDPTDDTRYILNLFGYKYDPEQDIYYTDIEAWQRNFGFAGIYDNAAPYANMRYKTLKIDFEYDGLLWRLQWWKGQYGVLEGAELGVYTKKPENEDFAFYKCADEDNLLEMYFEYYHSVADYNDKNPLFIRYEQEHWWITGFKFGVCNPTKNVVKATIILDTSSMADAVEEGLRNVTDKEGNPNGFIEYKPWTPVTSYDYYIREKLPDGRPVFHVIWKDAGYLNFSTLEDPKGDDDEEITTEEPTTSAPIVKPTKSANA